MNLVNQLHTINQMLNRRNGAISVAIVDVLDNFGGEKYNEYITELDYQLKIPFQTPDAGVNPVSVSVEALFSWMDKKPDAETEFRAEIAKALSLDYYKITRSYMVNDNYSRRHLELVAIGEEIIAKNGTAEFTELLDTATHLFSNVVMRHSRFNLLDQVLEGSTKWLSEDPEVDFAAGLALLRRAAVELRNYAADTVEKSKNGSKQLSADHLAKLKAGRQKGAVVAAVYSEQEIVDAMQMVGKIVGRTPSVAEFNRHSKEIKSGHVTAACGKFSQGQRIAGFVPTKRGRRKAN